MTLPVAQALRSRWVSGRGRSLLVAFALIFVLVVLNMCLNLVNISVRRHTGILIERQQGYRFELIPTGEQVLDMRRFAGSCRFVLNRALALQRDRRERGEGRLSYVALCKQLTDWRRSEETPWLADAPVHALQQSLKDLERAYANFFAGRAWFPQFRKKGRDESFRYPDPQQFRLEQGNNRIFLPKLGWLRYHNSRKVEGELRNVTVSIKGDKYFVSIQTRREVEVPVHPSTSAIGIDVGIANFAAFSDGSLVPPLNSAKKRQGRLKRYQRMMARRKKFGQNWKKAVKKAVKVATHIANCRKDFLHKASTTISKNHAVVVVEDLQVRNMSRSAKGTVKKPGRNVKQKTGLNRAILDQGWGEFRRMLSYKLDWAGGQLIAVPPQHTSQTCPLCGHVSADNRRTQTRFVCVKCGYENHADTVGAMNILERGCRSSAWSSTSPEVGASDQEPTEASHARFA